MAAINKLLHTTTGQHANYAGVALLSWVSIGALIAVYAMFARTSAVFTVSMLGAIAGLGLVRAPRAWQAQKRKDRVRQRPLDGIDDDELSFAMKAVSRIQDGPAWMYAVGLKEPRIEPAIYLGEGFAWDPEHAIKAWEIQNNVVRAPAQAGGDRGQRWIHALADKTEVIGLPTEHTSGNVCIYGTTGAGKTKMYLLFLKQAIMRGEPVVVIDPKGDKDLRRVMRETCKKIGKPERFTMFHPGFPEDSVRINLLANFSKPSELASRVAALLPNAKRGDPFVQFIVNVLIYIVSGMLMVGEKITLSGISSYVHNGVGDLLVRCIAWHAEKNIPGWQNEAKTYTEKSKGDSGRVNGFIAYYQQDMRMQAKSTVIEGLIDMHVHDRSHFEKMIVSLHPVLTFLTAGDIGPLLSPDPSDANDDRPITNLGRLIESGSAFYVGLDTLSDEKVGNAIGNLMLADMAAFAGDRYNYTDRDTPVNFFADEAGEVMTSPMIRVLNKARGAGVRTFLAAQTFSDYIVSLGSKDAAHQATGNTNTVIALRQNDPETQEEVIGTLPKVSMQTRRLSRSSSIEKGAARISKGSVGENLSVTEIERVSASLLSDLPNFEYFARFPSGQIIKGRIPLVS